MYTPIAMQNRVHPILQHVHSHRSPEKQGFNTEKKRTTLFCRVSSAK